MIPIILLGDENDAYIGKTLTQLLSNFGEVLHITPKKAEQLSGTRRCFLIYEPKSSISDFTSIKRGIVIFKEKAGTNNGIMIPPEVPVIVSSDNIDALQIIANSCTQNQVITCGLSVRDTISISAIKDSSASVSLQRRIRDIYGKWIAERELPMEKTESMTDFCLLIFAAIRLIAKLYDD